jgi:hypothetical protein
MKRLHRYRYKCKIEMFTSFSLLDPKKGHCHLKNPDPLKNLRDSDVTRCGSGSDTSVEHRLKKKHFSFNFTQIFPTVV